MISLLVITKLFPLYWLRILFKFSRQMRTWFCLRWKQIFLGFCTGLLFGILQQEKDHHQLPGPVHADGITSRISFSESFPEKLPDAIYNEQDDYEPNVLLEGHRISPLAQNIQHPVRPRYYASELGIHETLFVAISSSDETILSLGVAINKTSAHYLPRLSFFLNSANSVPLPVYQNLSMHIIRSSDTSDTLKFMMILKYISDNQVGNFDWFFIAKDSTYIRGKELVEFVKKISVGYPAFIGVPLKLEESIYCNIEAGILLNQAVMRKISENLAFCIENSVADDRTGNVGKCVHRASGLMCNEQQITANHLPGYFIRSAQNLHSEENTQQLVKSHPNLLTKVTFYPLTDPNQFYRLHLELSKKKIEQTKTKIDRIKLDIVTQSPNTPAQGGDLSWPIGINSANIPKNRFDVLEWLYFNSTHLLRPDDFRVSQPLLGADLQDIQRTVEFAAGSMGNRYAKQVLEFARLVNGYRKFDPSRGMEYILDLEFRATDSRVFQKRVRLLRALGQMEQIPMPFVTENYRVHITITVNPEEVNQTIKFLRRFASTHLKVEDNVFLMIVTIYGPQDSGKDQPDDVFARLKSEAREIDKAYQKSLGTRLGFLAIRKPFTVAPSEFAILDIVAKKFKKDSLIFRCDVHFLPSVELLNRLRLTAIAGWQVFVPIPFIQYKPNIIYKAEPYPEDFDIKRQFGHFDRNSFQYVAFYLSDYSSARRSVADDWPIINSDRDLLIEYSRPNMEASKVYDLYSLFLNTNLHVFRGVEPALKTEFFLLNCDKDGGNLDDRLRQRCAKRLMESLANKQQLALFFANHESFVS